MNRLFPRFSIWQLMLLAAFCGLLMAVLRTSWDSSRDLYLRVSFSPSGRLMMTNSAARGIEIWDLDEYWPLPRRMSIPARDSNNVPQAIGFTSDDSIFVVARSSVIGAPPRTDLLEWDVLRNEVIGEIRVEPASWQCAVALSGKVAVSADASGNSVTLWDVETSEELRSITIPAQLLSFDISDDAKTLLVVSQNRNGRRADVYDVSTGDHIEQLTSEHVWFPFFSMHDKYMVLYDEQSDMMIWNREERELVGRIKNSGAFREVFLCATFTSDESQLAVACYDGTIRFWDVESCQETNAWDGFEHTNLRGVQVPKTIAISPDGKTLAATHGSSEHGVTLHDVESGKQQRVIGRWNASRSMLIYGVCFLAWVVVWTRTTRRRQPRTGETNEDDVVRPTAWQVVRAAFVMLFGVSVVTAALYRIFFDDGNVDSMLLGFAGALALCFGTLCCAASAARIQRLW